MNTKHWRVTSGATRKQPELRSRQRPRRRSAHILEDFLSKRSRSSIEKSLWSKRNVSVSPLVRQHSQVAGPIAPLVKTKCGRSVDTLRKEVDPNRVSPLVKHRYFTLTEGPAYDLAATSVTQVRPIQAASELDLLLTSKEAYTPEVLRKKMLFHLDVKLAAMKEDQKKMQMTTFAPSSSDPHATAAFRALRARDELSVRSLVFMDKSLLTAVDATLLHWACKRQLESLAVFLIDQGADIGKKDMGGRTARDIARRKGLATLLAYMNKVKPNTKLHSAFFLRKAARKITNHVRARMEEHR